MPNVTVTKQIHFSMRNRGRREICEGPKAVPTVTNEGRVPRVVRLMALAIKIDGLIASGAIADQTEAAQVGHVTRARMTQIMNLVLLAPDIQEAILNLPRTTRGRDPIVETHLRSLTAETDWQQQRRMWQRLLGVDHECPPRRRRRRGGASNRQAAGTRSLSGSDMATSPVAT
jgi:hypothetical protein